VMGFVCAMTHTGASNSNKKSLRIV